MPGAAAVDKGTISGTVKDAKMSPVAGVAISTLPASATAMSDNNGAFTLTAVPIGNYSVVASKAGYSTYTLMGVGVAAGGTTNVSLAITVDPGAPGTISGVVTDSRGDPVKMTAANPIAGAIVTVQGQKMTATTDAKGAFTLVGVAPGPVFLSAAPPDPMKLLPTETRSAVMVAPGAAVAGVALVMSARPSDAANYVGMNDNSGGCASQCHGANNKNTGNKVDAVKSAAHNRSLTRVGRDNNGLALAGAWTTATATA